ARVSRCLLSHASSLRSALSRSACGAFLSTHTANIRAKSCAGVVPLGTIHAPILKKSGTLHIAYKGVGDSAKSMGVIEHVCQGLPGHKTEVACSLANLACFKRIFCLVM